MSLPRDWKDLHSVPVQAAFGKDCLCLKKPGSAKDFEVRWIWVRIRTFPISNCVILDEVLQFSGPQLSYL